MLHDHSRSFAPRAVLRHLGIAVFIPIAIALALPLLLLVVIAVYFVAAYHGIRMFFAWCFGKGPPAEYARPHFLEIANANPITPGNRES